MDIRKIFIIVSVVFSSPVFAAEFCYFWVESDGTITAYDKPPFNLSGPPFGGLKSDQGRLIIAQTEGPCLGSSLKKPEKKVRPTEATKILSGSLSSIGRY